MKRFLVVMVSFAMVSTGCGPVGKVLGKALNSGSKATARGGGKAAARGGAAGLAGKGATRGTTGRLASKATSRSSRAAARDEGMWGSTRNVVQDVATSPFSRFDFWNFEWKKKKRYAPTYTPPYTPPPRIPQVKIPKIPKIPKTVYIPRPDYEQLYQQQLHLQQQYSRRGY